MPCSPSSNFLQRHHRAIAAMLLIAGALTRLLYLTHNPSGLNQDEASAGYEAYALLTEGIDRNGCSWPALFISWGSGQNVLYSLLLIPFIAAFGLSVFSVRLLAALLGTATLFTFYCLAKRLRGPEFGLFALAALGFNPWHMMLSRWALESNILPFFLLLGIYLLVLSIDRPWLIIGSAAVFALSLYSYGTAFMFLPVFLPICIYIIHPKLRRLLPAAAVFGAIALPAAATQLINIFDLKQLTVLGITLPSLTQARQSATTILGCDMPVKGALANLYNFFKLLITQSDGLISNSMPGWGIYYFFGLPLIILGITAFIRTYKSKSLFPDRQPKPEWLIAAAALACLPSAALCSVNINRINMVFIPLIYFMALGLWQLGLFLKGFAPAVLAALALCFTLFLGAYWTRYQQDSSSLFYDGFGQAVEFAASRGAETEYYDVDVNMPYIYVLFYNEILPSEFVETVGYINPDGAFRYVSGFGKYQFNCDINSPDKNGVYVIDKGDASFFDEYEIAYFGNYAVAFK